MVILLFVKKHFCLLSNVSSTSLTDHSVRFGEIVVNYPNIGKTLNSIDLVNLMSSISVRFNSFLFFYSIFNERNLVGIADWSVWMDSNHRPRAYQARALTT